MNFWQPKITNLYLRYKLFIVDFRWINRLPFLTLGPDCKALISKETINKMPYQNIPKIFFKAILVGYKKGSQNIASSKTNDIHHLINDSFLCRSHAIVRRHRTAPSYGWLLSTTVCGSISLLFFSELRFLETADKMVSDRF